jgi:hypothetical protein
MPTPKRNQAKPKTVSGQAKPRAKRQRTQAAPVVTAKTRKRAAPPIEEPGPGAITEMQALPFILPVEPAEDELQSQAVTPPMPTEAKPVPLSGKAHQPTPGRPELAMRMASLATMAIGLLLIFSTGSPTGVQQTTLAALPGIVSAADSTIYVPPSERYIPLPTPTPAPVPTKPSSLRIPALGINSPMMTVGLLRGTIDTPCDPNYPFRPCNTNASAWYDGSSLPGSPGTAIIDGHELWYGAKKPYYVPAVFTHLYESKVGDQVIVTDAKGQVWVFQVDKIVSLPYPQVPANTFDAEGTPGVMLYTCGGVFSPALGGLDHRFYVHAALVGTGMPATLDPARHLIPFKQPWA